MENSSVAWKSKQDSQHHETAGRRFTDLAYAVDIRLLADDLQGMRIMTEATVEVVRG